MGLRELVGTTVDLTDEERATREALRDEYDRLEAEYAEADELPEEVDQRLGEIERRSAPSTAARWPSIPNRSAGQAPSSASTRRHAC